jgi:hypothetical protein
MLFGVNPSSGAGFVQTQRTDGTAAAYDLVINPTGGNLGIGTTTPQYELDLTNGSTANSIQAGFGATILAGNWTGLYFGYAEAGNNNYRKSGIAFERLDSSARGKIHILNDSVADAGSAVIEDSKVTIDQDGNVGIGTRSPGARLETFNNTGGQQAIRLNTNFAGGNFIDINPFISGVSNGGYSVSANGAIRMVIDTSGNMGVGTTTPGYRLEVNGSFAATTKSFVINHPTKEGMKLRYGSLEGPENGVYVRGRLQGTTRIELPDYWHALVHEDSITVNLTAVGKAQDLWVEEVTDTYITIASNDVVNCFYTVFAERKDVDQLVTEFDKE